MTPISLPSLVALAEAAKADLDVPDWRHICHDDGAINIGHGPAVDFILAASPDVVLALCARVRELEAGLPAELIAVEQDSSVQGHARQRYLCGVGMDGLAGGGYAHCPTREAQSARLRLLSAGLREALDRWEGWDVGQGRSAHLDRIRELRELAGEA